MEKEYKYLRNSLESVVNATERITTGNVAHEIGAIKCYTKLSQGYLDKLKQIEANGSKLKQIEANGSNINLDRVDTLLNLISILNRDPLNSLGSIKLYAQECLKLLLSE